MLLDVLDEIYTDVPSNYCKYETDSKHTKFLFHSSYFFIIYLYLRIHFLSMFYI